MIIEKYSSKEEWLQGRLGRITGTRLKDIIPKRDGGKKIGTYELIAERISTDPDGLAFNESPIERGLRLESEAIARFSKETGKKVNTDLVIWARDENKSIAISPDGSIGKTEAVESKSLSCARHIEAFITQKVPDEYEYQCLEYFIVNDKLKKLFVVFYDPRIPTKDFFYLTINRKDVESRIADLLKMQGEVLQYVDEWVVKLSDL